MDSKGKIKMAVLVTGGAGYIGSVLVRELLSIGYEVKCLDRFIFGKESLKEVEYDKNLEIIEADTRTFNPTVLNNVSVVVDLAAIGQPDPQQLIDPALFYDINYLGPVRVATLGKLKGVERYIFASTCSTYGFQKEVVDETSRLNPIDMYAKTKAQVEKYIFQLLDENFSVTALRFATLYGLSPKMRFDLVANTMTLSLYKYNKIMIGGDGTQVRPIVHVKDVANAIIKVIEAEKEKIAGEVFNVGSNEQNYNMLELADLIGSIRPGFKKEFFGEVDKRSYRVNFDKIKKVLNFNVEYTPEKGAKEVYSALENGSFMKITVIGSTGQVGSYLPRILSAKHDVIGLSHEELDITDFQKTRETLLKLKPELVINTAAYHKTDECEENPEKSFLVNSIAVRNLALTCKDLSAVLLHFSTDYVFDGRKNEASSEEQRK